MVEDEKICKPHGGTQVVENMPHSITESTIMYEMR